MTACGSPDAIRGEDGRSSGWMSRARHWLVEHGSGGPGEDFGGRWPGSDGRGSAWQAATPVGPFRPGGGPVMLCGCGVPEPVILTLDLAKAEADLARGGRSCRSCGQSLAPWGFARARSVAGPDGTRVRVRPRRARCRGCGATHVLLPAQVLPRCSAGSELVGQVLLAAAQGAGHRTISERCSLPEGTVRRWLRRAGTTPSGCVSWAPAAPTNWTRTCPRCATSPPRWRARLTPWRQQRRPRCASSDPSRPRGRRSAS